MADHNCVQFLQWALPQLSMTWSGFRRVYHRVCKRLQRRLRQLRLNDLAAYRAYLNAHVAEWQQLEVMCRIPVSRFYRDKQVYQALSDEWLPQLARHTLSQDISQLRLWSAGCASGEEPYTLALLWRQKLAAEFPGLNCRVVATDIEPQMLQRCHLACYTVSSIKNLPTTWISQAFTQVNHDYCLQNEYQQMVEFLQQDIRASRPDGLFDLIMCRNLVFTYFTIELQLTVLQQLWQALVPQGMLVIGVHESLPDECHGFTPLSQRLGIYIRSDEQDA